MGHFNNLLITLLEQPDPDDLELLDDTEDVPEEEGEPIAD